jgi:hypothetical protein
VGIHNIHFLNEPHDLHAARKVKEFTEAKRVLEHRAGRHPFGSKRRDCPLCVSGK